MDNEQSDFEPKQLQVPAYLHRRLFRYIGALTMERSEKVTVPVAIEHLLNIAESPAPHSVCQQNNRPKA